MILLTFIHMVFNSKKKNGNNKMRPNPKYMDLQPSQTWLMQWRLLNGHWICLNRMEAQQHNIWQNHIPNFVHKRRNYRNSTATGFLGKYALKIHPFLQNCLLFWNLLEVPQFGAFYAKLMSSIFLIRLHLVENYVANLLLETGRYRNRVVL